MSHTKLESPPLGPVGLNPPGEPHDNLTSLNRFAPPPFPRAARRGRFAPITFVLMVVLPSIAGIAYYGFIASQQFVTTAVMALRVGEDSDASSGSVAGSLVSSVGPPAGGPSVTQSYGLVNYVQSAPALADMVRNGVDVPAMLSRPEADFWNRLPENASKEALLQHWRSMLEVDFEITSGVITMRTRAFSPEDALTLSEAVIASSERMLNDVARRVHANELAYAESEVQGAEGRLNTARQQLQSFRARSGVLDLARSLGTNSDLETRLRQDIANSDAQAESLRTATGGSSPMVAAAMARSRAWRQQLDDLQRQTERSATERDGSPGAGIISRYELLASQVQLAERYYGQALDQLKNARLASIRQGTYLLTFVQPVLPTASTYPNRELSCATVVVCALLAWAVFMLLWRAVLDHA